MLLVLIVVLPVMLGAVAYYVRSVRIDLALLMAGGLFHLGATIGLWLVPVRPIEPYFAIDEAGRLILTLTSLLFVAAALYSIPYILDGTHHEQAAPRRYVPCLLWFLSSMTLVTATQHLALMWAAVEATTLASAPLVYFYRRRGALEATWKYLLICSVGIALALLGTFFLGIATSRPGGGSELTLSALCEAANGAARPWLKAAFVLAVVGYGTKMGLAPMHTWLPDTHSQAPSPVSALLSGALLNCAFLGILRFYQVCLAAGDASFARAVLILLGFASLGFAAAFMIGQRDYKRLLAYSSIENMGIVAAGVGLGGGACFGALLHAVNHSLCKAGLFFLAGNVLRVYGSTLAADVRGLGRRLPATGFLLSASMLAIGGFPPFGPFMSELTIFRSMVQGPHMWLGVVFIALLAVAFLGMAGTLLPLLQGQPSRIVPGAPARESTLSILTPAVLLGGVLVLGVHVPGFLIRSLQVASRLMGG